ncbi:LLM class flavin-dependent oxidoreductase [Novosphingobium sp.]|uniref:LLM class flavin-dependent oxidoreductase n=1 Tax=Novosphingobium sp. TaxID=1874826 RepID=UPI003BACD1BE
MSQPYRDDPRSASNPLFNENRLKLGIFGINGPGVAMTKVAEAFVPTWANSRAIAEEADKAGFETIVPYARWRPFAGDDHPSGRTFETYNWAAALSALTSRSCVMSTSHVPTIHPLVAAKQAATIDHISGGRFAINIVCGWYTPEIEMFGADIRTHTDRYGHADEWITVMKRLWTEGDAFDFDGKFVQLRKAVSNPKPLQQPHPALMNAGGSDAGQLFAAKHADIAFILVRSPRPEDIKAQVDAYRDLARREFGRNIQIWVHAYVVQRDSISDALAYVDHYADIYGDHEVANEFLKHQLVGAQTVPPEILSKMRQSFMAGAGGVPLLGTPTDIVAAMSGLSACGIDGILLTWVDYAEGLPRFVREVLPLIEQAGLRQSL